MVGGWVEDSGGEPGSSAQAYFHFLSPEARSWGRPQPFSCSRALPQPAGIAHTPSRSPSHQKQEMRGQGRLPGVSVRALTRGGDRGSSSLHLWESSGTGLAALPSGTAQPALPLRPVTAASLGPERE